MPPSVRRETPFPAPRAQRIAFDRFEVDLRAGELRKDGHRIRLQAQPFQLLAVLLEHGGEVVTRDEVCRKLWPDDTFVDFDHSLAAAVNKIREALGDSAENSRFVETLPKRGYRFIAEIRREALASPALINADATGSAAAKRPETRQSAWSWKATWVLLGVAATLAVLLAWAKWRPTAHGGYENLTVVPFTSYPGIETAPALSPDGTRIAFAWDGGEVAGSKKAQGNYDLYVKAMGSETRLRLTNHPSQWVSPAWSPDGTQIAFHRTAGADTGIYIVPAFGGPERKLRPSNVMFEPPSALSWSPDGKWLAYSEFANDKPVYRAFLLSLETLEDQEFPHDPACNHESNLTFSHDGRQFAWVCVHTTNSLDLMVQDVKGGKRRSLATFRDSIPGLAWAADDNGVIVPQSPGGHEELSYVRLSDGAKKTLALQPSGAWPTVSTTGEKLAFSTFNGHANIWRKDLTHPDLAPVQMLASTRGQNSATYSPEGKHIAFDSSRSGVWSIWLADADGTNLVQISHNQPSEHPEWSPDSQEVAFEVSEPEGRAAIYVASVTDRVPRKLKTNAEQMTHPSWSRDGKWIYFRGYDTTGHNLYRCPAEGGDAMELTKGLNSVAPKESYDGKVLYFLDWGGGTRLKMIVIGPDGATAGSFVEGMPEIATDQLWAVGPRGIYFVPLLAPRTVSYFDFATRKTREVLKGDGVFSDGISVSPDGRYILFSQMDEMNSDIMLVEKFR